MFPGAINICICLLCFGYVSPVQRDYSTQPGEKDVYINSENNTSLSDLYKITNEEDSFKGLTDAGELKQDRPTENVRLKDWKKYKCIIGKEDVVTTVYSTSNITFTKGDESRNGYYCFIFICNDHINGSKSTGVCVYVITVNATELAMAGVKDEEIEFGKTPGIFVQFLLFVKDNAINYFYNDENKINNEEIGVIGPLQENEGFDGERKGIRLIKVLEDTNSIISEVEYCIQNLEIAAIVVYNALDGTFTEVGTMDDTLHLVAPGFYRVNTNLTIRMCVNMNSISKVEFSTILLELSKIHGIPFYRRFIIALTPRVFVNCYISWENEYNISNFVNFTYNDFITAINMFNFLETFQYQILYVTATISILGNLLICAVIIKYKTMRNCPNIYLFSLALAHIAIFSTGLYLELVIPKRLDKGVPFFISVMSIASLEVNIWTTVGITIDRYVAICHPFLARTVSTQSKAVKVNIAIWIVSFFHSLFFVNSPNAFHAPGMDILGIIFYIFNSATANSILFVLFPMFIIIVLYVFIVRSIWKSSKMKGSSNTRVQSTTGKSLKLSVAIVVQFFVCYVPINALYYLRNFLRSNVFDQAYIDMLERICRMALMVALTTDLVLYALVSKRFRDAFKDILCLGWIRR